MVNRNPLAWHAEALEEVATSITEEAWLYNEDAFYFCFYYIHDSNLSSYIRFSKTYPSFLTVKEGSTSHPAPLSSGAREETALLGARNRYALRLADHQRSSPCCAGWDHLAIACRLGAWERMVGTTRIDPHCSIALHLSPLE